MSWLSCVDESKSAQQVVERTAENISDELDLDIRDDAPLRLDPDNGKPANIPASQLQPARKLFLRPVSRLPPSADIWAAEIGFWGFARDCHAGG